MLIRGPHPRRLAAFLLASALPLAGLAQESAVLSSAPIDLSLFRDGEVRRLAGIFGQWTVVCDEIVRLKRRYCSLRSSVADAAGRPVARIDVSTGDDGRPAALLHLPLGLVLPDGVEISMRAPQRGKPAPPRHVAIAACDARECQAVWSVGALELDGLMRGDGVLLRYRVLRNPALPVLRQDGAARPVVSGLVTADGFDAAIKASLR